MLTTSHGGTATRSRAHHAPQADPLFVTTVPRGYVHRASVAEVLLTGWHRSTTGPTAGADADRDRDHFTVHAQWPRNHAFHTAAGGYQDSLLLVETIRQAGILLSHAEYAVPLDFQFVMHQIGFTADAAAFACAPRPTDLELRVTCRDISLRGTTIGAMAYDVLVLRDGEPVGRGGARFNCVSPSVHRRMRGERSTVTGYPIPAPISPAAVGHASERNVVLGTPEPGRSNRWQLRVDTEHPAFFDHPVDHVPGMLLAEAARQAARAAAGEPDALLLALDSRFARYAELDEPCWVQADVEEGGAGGSDGRRRIRVVAGQGEDPVCQTSLVLGGLA